MELMEAKGEMAKANERLAAAQTALTYERNSNEKLKVGISHLHEKLKCRGIQTRLPMGSGLLTLESHS